MGRFLINAITPILSIERIAIWVGNRGIVKRLGYIALYIGLLFGFLMMVIVIPMFQMFIWFLVNLIELIMTLPFFLIWLVTGKFYGSKIEGYLRKNTYIFTSLEDCV